MQVTNLEKGELVAMDKTAEKTTATEEKPIVLFLCTRNSARSQMAEAWLRNLAGQRFVAASAGLEPSHIHPMTMQVMEEVGLPLEGHRSKPISEFLGRVAVRHIFVVCESAEKNCPRLWPFGGQLKLWPFEDPAAQEGDQFTQLAKFREVRDQVEQQIRTWLEEQ
jgi:arsenate reductase (thioredoxin)